VKDSVVRLFLKKSSTVRGKIRSVYLFGSRAKGTDRPDSDYDILLVVKPAFSGKDKDALYDAVLHVLFETGKVVSLKIFKEKEFKHLCGLGTPFMQHIMTEGIKIG